MRRSDNIDIFNDTLALCKDMPVLANSVEKSISEQILLLEADEQNIPELKVYDEKAKVIVSKKRTYEAASAYKGSRTAVHNFANAIYPGGGVTAGSMAQEECLCRCSTLYPCLNVKEMLDGFYTPHKVANDVMFNGDVIYTPGVTVFKSDVEWPLLMDESDWYEVDVMTCAAPYLVETDRCRLVDENGVEMTGSEALFATHVKRLSRMLNIAVSKNVETVILGAFGCGAFMNDPSIVAEAAKTVTEKYLYSFKNIEFAIYCSPFYTKNYDEFSEKIAPYI